MNKRRFVWLILAFGAVSIQSWGQSTTPQTYISTLNSHQIQSVNLTTGATTTIYFDNSTTGDFSNFLPEGVTLGQDSKIYVAVTQNNKIVRMNQDGSEFETVYDQGACDCSGPVSPEGPVIDAAGNLFFNTASGHSGVWEIAAATSIPFGGTFPNPTNVVTATQTGSTFGEGLAFGGTFPVILRLNPPGSRSRERRAVNAELKSIFPTIGGLLTSARLFGGPLVPSPRPAAPVSDPPPNLLIVDQSHNQILIWDGVSSVTTLISATETGCTPLCLDAPIGVAVNPITGDIFVANSGLDTANVNRFDTNGNFKETYVASFPSSGCDGCVYFPVFLAFDSSGNLFVTTATTTSGNTGNVWEVTSNASKNNLTNNTTFDVRAWGITAPVLGEPLNPAGGTNIYTFGSTKIKFVYPPDSSFAGETLFVFAVPTNQDALTAQTNGGAFEGAQIIVFDGTGGNDLTFVTYCETSTGNPCPGPTAALTYHVLVSYDAVPPGAIPSNPIFLKKPDDAPIYDSSPPLPAGNGNILDNFYIMRIDPTGSGTTSCRSGSRCFHDFILANLPPDPNGPVAATFNGFLPPLAPGNRRVFNCGDTVPVRFTLRGLSSAFDPKQVVARISVERGSTPKATHNANSQQGPGGNLFLLLAGTFQYDLSLGGYPPGNYTIIVTSNSFPTQTVTFSVSSSSCGPGQ
ncbi:MAG TPA: hypothetical protein VJV74_14230 [Terriglobia bacterium]|nr:hypothetical protein [Terriglobia bacterium]